MIPPLTRRFGKGYMRQIFFLRLLANGKTAKVCCWVSIYQNNANNYTLQMFTFSGIAAAFYISTALAENTLQTEE